MAETVERGVYRDKYGYRVCWRSGGTTHEKRFPKTTSLAAMRGWREREIRQAEWSAKLPPTASADQQSPDGWCYVYFVRSGETVKIGKAKHVGKRLANLRTAQPQRLQLLAAVPAHRQLETAIQNHFQHLRIDGEWFQLDAELIAFINAVRDGANPVALLFEPRMIQEWSEKELHATQWLEQHRRRALARLAAATVTGEEGR